MKGRRTKDEMISYVSQFIAPIATMGKRLGAITVHYTLEDIQLAHSLMQDIESHQREDHAPRPTPSPKEVAS